MHGRAFTYGELEEATRRAASRLADLSEGLPEGRVAMIATPDFPTIGTLLGIWRAGRVAVPLASSFPRSELEYVIGDAEAVAVASDEQSAALVQPLAAAAGARFVTFNQLIESDVTNGPGDIETGSTPALMMYTSGTTGRPKGVVATHGNVAAWIRTLVEAWEWSADDRALLVLPLHHTHGLINVVGSALWAGATCELMPRFDPEATWERLASGDITVFTAVPTIYQRLIASWEAATPTQQRARRAGASRARLMMSGSAALPIPVLERWREITGHTLLERYGMTEIGMALSNPLSGERRPGVVGTPLPGVDVRLVDADGREIESGLQGELEVRGPGVFKEYWRRPDVTRQAFRDGWFRTGDVAVVDRGAYRLLGRTSTDILKTGGEKISAIEIEEVLRLHPVVLDCAVVGVPDERWGDRVCVAAELRADADLSLPELQAWVKDRLAPPKVPKQLLCVESLPRNAMGKVVKSEVIALFRKVGPPARGD